MSSRSTILVVAEGVAQARDLAATAAALVATGSWRIVFSALSELRPMLEELMQKHVGWTWVDPRGRPWTQSTTAGTNATSSSPRRSLSTVVRALVPPHRRRTSVVVQLARRRSQLRDAAALLAAVTPDAILLAEDQVETASTALIAEAQRRRIATIITPFTFATSREPAETYKLDNAHGMTRPFNRLAARMWPKWAIEYEGRTLLRLPAAGVFAMELCRLAPPDPWQYNSGTADVIACESEAIRQYFMAAGISTERLQVVGSVALDTLAITRRNVTPNSPRRMVVALPPNQFDVRAAFTSVPTYDDLLDFWCRTAEAAVGWDVIYSVHPRTPITAVMPHIKRGSIAAVPLPTILPTADLFVACASATIRWAIACGVPVLNYDAYQYRYHDYAGVGGVMTVHDPGAFRSGMERLVSNSTALGEIAAAQAKDAATWGVLDGDGIKRLSTLIDQQIQRKRGTHV